MVLEIDGEPKGAVFSGLQELADFFPTFWKLTDFIFGKHGKQIKNLLEHPDGLVLKSTNPLVDYGLVKLGSDGVARLTETGNLFAKNMPSELSHFYRPSVTLFNIFFSIGFKGVSISDLVCEFNFNRSSVEKQLKRLYSNNLIENDGLVKLTETGEQVFLDYFLSFKRLTGAIGIPHRILNPPANGPYTFGRFVEIKLDTLKNKLGRLCAWRDQPEYDWLSEFIESVIESDVIEELDPGALVGIVMDSRRKKRKAYKVSFGRLNQEGILEMEMGFERFPFSKTKRFMNLTYGLTGGAQLEELLVAAKGDLLFGQPRCVNVPEAQYKSMMDRIGLRSAIIYHK